MSCNKRPGKHPVKILSTAVVLSLSLALSACGDADTNTDTPTNASTTEPADNSANDSNAAPDNGTASGDVNSVDSKDSTENVTTPKEETPDNSQTPPGSSNPYETAGIDHPDQFNKFFTSVQKAVADGDKEQVADAVLYPLRVNANGTSQNYKDKTAFLADYDSIMTDSVKKALADQKLDTLFVNYKGVMVGSGEIWFGASPDAKDKYGIIAVNKDQPGTSKK
ncbi:hypothetical protein ACTHPF_00740 [Paenibacillus sp. SAF-054]|uniref:hypothetical protein n=1 Tax=unclassified Paenibacillus TaxID=185978 RepID=UPI003F80BFDE